MLGSIESESRRMESGRTMFEGRERTPLPMLWLHRCTRMTCLNSRLQPPDLRARCLTEGYTADDYSPYPPPPQKADRFLCAESPELYL